VTTRRIMHHIPVASSVNQTHIHFAIRMNRNKATRHPCKKTSSFCKRNKQLRHVGTAIPVQAHDNVFVRRFYPHELKCRSQAGGCPCTLRAERGSVHTGTCRKLSRPRESLAQAPVAA